MDTVGRPLPINYKLAIQVLVMIGTVSGWGLGIYMTVEQEVFANKQTVALVQQRQLTDENSMTDFRAQVQATNSEIRSQLAKMQEQLSDLRALLAGMHDGKH